MDDGGTEYADTASSDTHDVARHVSRGIRLFWMKRKRTGAPPRKHPLKGEVAPKKRAQDCSRRVDTLLGTKARMEL
jgi:hypothetical protein